MASKDHDRIDRARRYSSQLGPDMDGSDVVVAGWVQEYRNLGGIAFIQLRDRDGIVQITLLKKKDLNMFSNAEKLQRESVIAVKGKLKASKKAKAGFEILPDRMDVLSLSKAPLPMGVADKVGIELDTRLDNRFLDLRRENVAAIFKIRSTMVSAVRTSLEKEGFLEVHTPKIVATATEGGTSLFSMKYFDRPAYLNQSPQLYKQMLMASGLDRIFEIGPAFRAEEHDTVRHLNEFTSIDIEMAFSNEDDAMDMLEMVVANVIDAVRSKDQRELTTLGIDLEAVTLPFPKLTFDECVKIAISKGVEAKYDEDLSMEAMKAVATEHPGYYFITRWPTRTKPFYAQPFEDDMGKARAFDLMFAEKEITSGAQRVHDVSLLRENLKAKGLDPLDFDFYIKAFEFGMPPHSGWGLGLERLLMIMTGMENVRECVLFPRDKKRVVP